MAKTEVKIGLHTVVCAKHLHASRSLLKMINLHTLYLASNLFWRRPYLANSSRRDPSYWMTSWQKGKHHLERCVANIILNFGWTLYSQRCCAILAYNCIYVAWFHAEKFCEIAERLELCSVKIGHPRKVLLQFNLAWKVQASGTGLVDRLKHSQD